MKKILLATILVLITSNANDLSTEQSPYLLQHKDNPVNWHAWNKKTLKLAQQQNKLIFLSIGYSTCHWCHVMEEESFEHSDVAKVLNKSYISIKVDREEMPQLDSYYQSVYQYMNGRGGGWPLTILLTPDLKPFWSGTYIPKNNLINLLNEVSQLKKANLSEITQVANNVDKEMKQRHSTQTKKVNLELKKHMQKFKQSIQNGYDELNGGMGAAPKFPRATLLMAMLDTYALTHDKKILDMVNTTLTRMSQGGIYDQIEGGFYRYSVDAQWRIPHFEKMLYTQAELLTAYTKAYQLTSNDKYKTIAAQIISLVKARFTENNLLWSASDADSLTAKGEKEEGHYFVFDHKETKTFLENNGYTSKQAIDILSHFNITPSGNFEHGLSNPNILESKSIQNVENAKKNLLSLRGKKQYPFIDKKIQTSWNSMYISSLFKAGVIDNKYSKQAKIMLDTLLKELYPNQKLYHQKLQGRPLQVKAYFEDYAFLIDALIEAYQFEYDKKYIHLASKLTKEAKDKFYSDGKWWLSDDEFKTPASSIDSAYASASATMTRNIFKVSLLTDDYDLNKLASSSLSSLMPDIDTYPVAAPTAYMAYLGDSYRYKVLKSSKENLLNNRQKIKQIKDPFLLTKAMDNSKDSYLACVIDSCFATEVSLNKIIERIRKYR